MFVRKEMLKKLKSERSDTFCIDLTDVTQCDSAGLALLIDVKKLCSHSNKKFKLIEVPAKIQSLAEFCGVSTILTSLG